MTALPQLKVTPLPEETSGSGLVPDVRPLDEHNLRLLANVHPSDWRNPEPAPRYNLVVIGAGTAGLITAAGAAGLGAKVALVERNLMGGDCLNVGCVPSKCIIRSSRVAADIRDAVRFGVIPAQGTEIDFGAVMERMRQLRARISHNDSAERYQNTLGVDVFLGQARFTGADTVAVGETTLRFVKAVVATGARAVHPDVPGLAEAGFLTNETVFNLTERPRRLAVIGAGPIGCELAQAFSRLGSAVTIIQRPAQFLPREDPDAAAILQAQFERDGIAVRLRSVAVKVDRRGSEKILTLRSGDRVEELVVDEILVGAGRAPNVEGLDLEKVGVEYGPKGVAVNDYLQTTNPRIFAAGDICLQHQFTHLADFSARLVIQNALFSPFGIGRRRLSALTIPWCTYTEPEIAHVGMYEHDAQKAGVAIDTFTVPMHDVDRAIADGEEEGFVKVHVKKGSDRILGATIVGRHAGEMISEITLAMVGRLGLGTIASTIHPYPTQAESIRKVADAYNRTRLTPRVKRLFSAILHWGRRG